jgi:hypothetical protein
MLIISLKDFALTGHFGPIGLGMSKDDLIAHLGEPDGINQFSDTVDINYAWYEFFCFNSTGKICGIQNDHLSLRIIHQRRRIKWQREAICFENDHFRIDTWFLKPGKDVSYFQAIALLNNENIPFQEIFDEFTGWRVQFESGVFIDFDHRWDSEETNDPPTEKEKVVVNGIRIFEQHRKK